MCTGRHAFLNKIVFWPKKVKKILQKLDIENANGPDSIPARRRMSVDVYMLSSAYSVSFMGSCVIAACYEFIMFYIDLLILITREAN